jgi:hypothetical protein
MCYTLQRGISGALGGESIAEEVTSGRRKKKINAEDHRGTEYTEKKGRERGQVLFPFLIFNFGPLPGELRCGRRGVCREASAQTETEHGGAGPAAGGCAASVEPVCDGT